jgi:hypothetical protein
MSKAEKMAALNNRKISTTTCKVLLGHADFSESELRTIAQSPDKNAQDYFKKLVDSRHIKMKNLIERAHMNMDC